MIRPRLSMSVFPMDGENLAQSVLSMLSTHHTHTHTHTLSLIHSASQGRCRRAVGHVAAAVCHGGVNNDERRRDNDSCDRGVDANHHNALGRRRHAGYHHNHHHHLSLASISLHRHHQLAATRVAPTSMRLWNWTGCSGLVRCVGALM
jgi:hypothetical protein